MKRLAPLLPVLALSACAGMARPPAPGQTEAEVLQRMGRPSATYAMAGGARRLEYATGPWGRQTWMVDVDAGGRVTGATQVLEESSLQAFQARAPGMAREELLRTLGTPGERKSGGWQGGEVWSWRYPTNDCLWFQVSVGSDGKVRDGIFNIDPRCDAPSDKAPQ